MANMNLSTGNANGSAKKIPMSSSGVLLGLVLLVIAVMVVAALFFWKNNLDKKVSIAEGSYQTKYAGLTEGRNKDVIDFQSRIFALNSLVGQRNAVTDAMQNVEKYLVAGAYVSSYDFDKSTNTIKLGCVAENHEVIAKQIASFKNLEYFSDVILRSTKASDKGGFDFSIEIINK